jgi:hypothetical protein
VFPRFAFKFNICTAYAAAKSAIEPEKIKCMCHEVAVAAAVRSRYG